MESKLLIDIGPTGEPFLFVDLKTSDDLRDKVLSRFLYESDGMKLSANGDIPNPTRLDLHVLWHDEQSGRVQAMIEHPSTGKESDILRQMDNMCVESLDPDLYEKWDKIVKALMNRRRSLNIV